MQDEKDKLNQNLSVALGAVSLLAILGLLVRNNFETNEILGAIINLTQVAIPVFVLLMTMKMKKETKSYLNIGKEALIKLQKDNPSLLMGPMFHRVDPETGIGNEYLFIKDPKKEKSLNRAKFITIEGLKKGVLAIYIQKGTLAYGKSMGKGNVEESEVDNLRNKVCDSVYEKAKTYMDDVESLYTCTGKQTTDSGEDDEMNKAKVTKELAIQIGFNEQKMGHKKFFEAIYNCADVAVQTIKNYKE